MNSLRTRLLVIIGGSLLVLWTAVAAWMLAGLRTEMLTALDERLAASARMVAGLASQFAAPERATVPAAALMDVVARDGVACEVSLLRGEVAAQKVARIGASPPMESAPTGYSTQVHGGRLWRTYVLEQGGVRVATADRIDLRESLLRDVAMTAAVPFAVALAGSLVMLWFGVGRGLAPLERMRRVLAARRPDDDAPLPQARVPRELAPLVDTLARLLERVRGAMARERRFTDDAAHELRTPLTGVKTHLQVLRMALRAQPQRQDVRDALDHADAGVQRMQRTIEQLLLLARLEGEAAPAVIEPAQPQAAAQQAAREAQHARPQGACIRVEAAPDLPAVAVPEALLVSALRNLLDNALNAAPQGSCVTLAIAHAPGQVRFTVLDEGPGLSPEECALATRRFWRGGKTGAGSGLGLAITSTIAQRHGGTLQLAPRAPRGLCAELALPAG